jgi:hypothetical protein
MFFKYHNPSCQAIALESTRPPTGMATTVHKAQNITVIYEQIVQDIWNHRCIKILWVSANCYKDSFTFVPLNYATLSVVRMGYMFGSHRFYSHKEKGIFFYKAS